MGKRWDKIELETCQVLATIYMQEETFSFVWFVCVCVLAGWYAGNHIIIGATP